MLVCVFVWLSGMFGFDNDFVVAVFIVVIIAITKLKDVENSVQYLNDRCYHYYVI